MRDGLHQASNDLLMMMDENVPDEEGRIFAERFRSVWAFEMSDWSPVTTYRTPRSYTNSMVPAVPSCFFMTAPVAASNTVIGAEYPGVQ